MACVVMEVNLHPLLTETGHNNNNSNSNRKMIVNGTATTTTTKTSTTNTAAWGWNPGRSVCLNGVVRRNLIFNENTLQ